MLSTSNLKSAQAATYFEKDDYYSHEDGPNHSRWIGKGAEQLQLVGGVEQETFQQVLMGKSPGGQPLFSRRIDLATRRAATDFTFSAPKSVSVAALVQGDQRVVEAHRIAVDRTLQVVEARYAQTRVTTENGRCMVKTGNMVAAVFPHGTSREAEPQLHSHCVVMNATQLENGSWYSFSNDSAIMNKKLLGQIYQNELAVELKKIGYEINQKGHGQFDIKGYSPELLKTFSTRRGQIEALIAEWKASGRTVRDAEGNQIRSDLLLREVANLQTRKAKPQIVEAGQLLQSWQAVIAMQGLSLPALPDEHLVVEKDGAIAPALSPIINDAIAHCGERDAIFRTTAIEKFAFEHHIGELSVVELEQAIASHPELLKVDETKGKVTTQTALQLELATIRLMQQGQGQVSAIATGDEIAHQFEGSSLSAEQRSAITTSCQSSDQFIGWQGAAGAGKTYALSAFKEIAESQGYEVSGYAPSAAAAHELGESLSIETNTVARLLLEASVTEGTSKQKRTRQLWLIDEAGLLSMRDARALLARATKSNARVVLVGDTRQLSAVEAGNPFRSLQAGGMVTARLDQARRQQQAELRQAVQMISQGEVNAGIQVLERSGCISEIEDSQERTKQLVNDFLKLTADERQQTLLLSGTNANRLALTEQIRQGMQAEGSLGENAYKMQSLQRKDLTQVQGRYASHYAINDVIVPIRDYKRQGLEKNQQYRVSAIDALSNTLTMATSDRQLVQIDPALCERKAVYTTLDVEIAAGDHLKWTKNNRIVGTRNGQQFAVEHITPEGIAQIVNDQEEARTIDLSAGAQHIDYAWVSTTYSSQGKTAGTVMALMDSSINREAFYVATSRAKHDLQLYTADLQKLRERADKTRANENVSDYLPLFEIAKNEQSLSEQIASADYAREIANDVGRSVSDRQRTATRCYQPEQSANLRARNSTPGYVAEFDGVPERVEKHARQIQRQGQVLQVGEADLSIDSSVEQIQQRAGTGDRIAGAVAQLHRDVKRTTRSRQSGSRWPRPKHRRAVEKPVLRRKVQAEAENLTIPAPPVVPEQTYKPVELKPPSPDASLQQQLDDFAKVLGYEPGDRLYVRALLPKNLSDELSIKHRLKFEIEENGKKRLIPNTRRGYLTVGSWEFTHIRKGKEPAIHTDGLSALTELNKEGRGIYFVVNPGGEKDGEISGARSLFWENDDKTKAEQIEQARTSGLPLGAVIETNKSIHCYSPLAEPIQDMDAWKQLQERLIQRMESDPAIRNSSRLMRLPGFDHVRVEQNDRKGKQLVFTPITLRHIDQTAQDTSEAIASKLPEWEVARWTKEQSTGRGERSRQRRGEAAAPTLAADNPWDIRNFSQYLDGEQFSQNGWLQVQCPHHGGEGSSGTSLNINEATGQYKCHSGCDSKDIYRAAWDLAESRGWRSPKQKTKATAELTTQTTPTPTKPVPKESNRPLTRWERYSASIAEPPGPQRDLLIAKRAIADGLSKKQAIALLAKNSPKAQKLYRDEGSTPAYNYVEMVVKAAQQQGTQAQVRLKSKGAER